MMKNVLTTVLCLTVFALTFQVTSFSVFAQSRPVISPWMGLFDRSRDASGLDNYNRLVKPRQDMLKAYANQAAQIQAQQRTMQMLQNNASPSGSASTNLRDLAGIAGGAASGRGGLSGDNTLLSPPREIPSSRSPATFNQYLHYYPAGGLPRQSVPNFSSAGRGR